MTTLLTPRLRLAAGVAVLLLLAVITYLLSDALTPFAVAFTLAYFLNPLVNAAEDFLTRHQARTPTLRKLVDPRTAAVGILAALCCLVLLVLLVVVLPEAFRQSSDAAAKLPEYVRRLRTRLEPMRQWLDVRYPGELDEIRQRMIETAKAHLPEILAPVTHAVQTAFSSLLGLVLTILNLLIIPVFTAYLLFDMNHIKAGARELVPHGLRPYTFSRLGDVDRLLSAFVRGQITVALILGTFYAIGLTLCGVPLGLIAGMVIGFFNLVPFMSYIAGLPIALLLSWVDDQSLPRLVAVVAVFTSGQFVEGNFITPRIVGRSLGLHAVVIMLAVLVGGTAFGFIGMLLAVPVTAVLSVFWKDLREAYLGSEFYRRAGAGPAAPSQEEAEDA